jgi:hypothetical protein
MAPQLTGTLPLEDPPEEDPPDDDDPPTDDPPDENGLALGAVSRAEQPVAEQTPAASVSTTA